MDRVQKIRQIIGENGEESFYLSFSGGKDSTVLSALIDEALPGNKIPRVFINTGIEYNMLVKFVRDMAAHDPRVQIIPSGVNIVKMLERDGYPFKSKQHSNNLSIYQHSGMMPYLEKYAKGLPPYDNRFKCPEKLRYQFTPAFKLKCSDMCCHRLKVESFSRFQKSAKRSGNPYTWRIQGLMKAEGGGA